MNKTVSLLLVAGLFLMSLPGCGVLAPEPTADTQATVDAAVAATSQAQADAAAAEQNTQATVDAAVAATGTAQAASAASEVDQQATADAVAASNQATVDSAVAATKAAEEAVEATVDASAAATRAAEPTSTPAPEYIAMTEDEMASAIDESAQEANAATQEATDMAVNAAADGTVTQEELDEIEAYLLLAEEAIVYTEDLLDAYYGLYADLALETIYLLEDVEEDLSSLSQSASDIDEMLTDFESALQQGYEVQQENIDQLLALAEEASGIATEYESAADNWQQELESELQTRIEQALAVQPNNIPSDRKAAIESAKAYLDSVLGAVGDNKITPEELAAIAQNGANAAAGISNFGGAQLSQLSGSINQITGQLASGNLPSAKASIGSFESLLKSIPSLP